LGEKICNTVFGKMVGVFPGEHSLLLLAGGVGINPLLSMWLEAR
jgi:ferredoxin-NADP reductase